VVEPRRMCRLCMQIACCLWKGRTVCSMVIGDGFCSLGTGKGF
jgi:hypothetical protein